MQGYSWYYPPFFLLSHAGAFLPSFAKSGSKALSAELKKTLCRISSVLFELDFYQEVERILEYHFYMIFRNYKLDFITKF